MYVYHNWIETENHWWNPCCLYNVVVGHVCCCWYCRRLRCCWIYGILLAEARVSRLLYNRIVAKRWMKPNANTNQKRKTTTRRIKWWWWRWRWRKYIYRLNYTTNCSLNIYGNIYVCRLIYTCTQCTQKSCLNALVYSDHLSADWALSFIEFFPYTHTHTLLYCSDIGSYCTFIAHATMVHTSLFLHFYAQTHTQKQRTNKKKSMKTMSEYHQKHALCSKHL